ncbi:hypothetical protein PISMIDRAFT_12527 [Pisolithus microcarpus 441]|uniref:Uncharacterized protein n=1 Tax=Pisolithus microcarpus 441 TaxID=765257 RepID=A0A0C9YW98_9AGAM|nr:hypothetical protein PISMIDRAFT_12527 [Pisolithus microcarpus 441]
MITPDTRSSSQSSLDIDMSKQFAVVLQNVFRSIDVNPDDVDYGICRRSFQYISGANRVKQMEVFTGVGPNEFKVISAIAEDRSFAFLKPRLTYDACSKVLIVKMPSALHEAPLDELKTVLERKLDYLPSHPGRSMVRTNAHMNCSIRFNNSEFVPDMLLSLRDISERTNEPSMFLLIGECAFSQNEAILHDKLKKITVELPDLVTVVMIVIQEDAPFNLPQQKSAAWEFFKSHGTLLSQKEFLTLCTDLSEPICLGKSITIGGHTWCHLAAVEYFIWVREVGGNLIDIDNSGADSSVRGMLFPEIRMGEVDVMFDKAISAFKDSIVLFFEQLGESFETDDPSEEEPPPKRRIPSQHTQFPAVPSCNFLATVPVPGSGAQTAPGPLQTNIGLAVAEGVVPAHPLASRTAPNARVHHLPGAKPLPTSVDVHHFFEKIKDISTTCCQCKVQAEVHNESWHSYCYSPSMSNASLCVHIVNWHLEEYLVLAEEHKWSIQIDIVQNAFTAGLLSSVLLRQSPTLTEAGGTQGYTFRTLKVALTQSGFDIHKLPPAPAPEPGDTSPGDFLMPAWHLRWGHDGIPEFTIAAMREQIVWFIVADDQSINVIECPKFRHLILLLRQDLQETDIPCRTKLHELILEAWRDYFRILKQDLVKALG